MIDLLDLWLKMTVLFTLIATLRLIGKPKIVKLKVRKEVEKLLEGKGVEILDAAYLSNRFSQSVSFGGAGGMGNSEIGSITCEKFVEKIMKNSIKIVYYAFKEAESGFTKKYWGLTKEGALIEFIDVHLVENSSMYSIELNDESNIDFMKEEHTFHRNIVGYLMYAAFISAIITTFLVIVYAIYDLFTSLPSWYRQ